MEITPLAFMGLPGGTEWIVIGLIALLIFGRRLPDVARSVGKSIVEFKKGIRDVKDDVEKQSRLSDDPEPRPADRTEQSTAAPSEPIQQAPEVKQPAPPEQSAH